MCTHAYVRLTPVTPLSLLLSDQVALVSAQSVHLKLHSHVPEELWSAITHHRANLDYHCLSISVLRLYLWCDDNVCSPGGATDDHVTVEAESGEPISEDMNTAL